MAAYPTIYLACPRDHTRADQFGNPLTENQASVLHHLDAARPTTLSKLAEHMNPLLVRQLLKRMEPEEADRALAGIERLSHAAAILLKRRKRERDG